MDICSADKLINQFVRRSHSSKCLRVAVINPALVIDSYVGPGFHFDKIGILRVLHKVKCAVIQSLDHGCCRLVNSGLLGM